MDYFFGDMTRSGRRHVKMSEVRRKMEEVLHTRKALYVYCMRQLQITDWLVLLVVLVKVKLGMLIVACVHLSCHSLISFVL